MGGAGSSPPTLFRDSASPLFSPAGKLARGSAVYRSMRPLLIGLCALVSVGCLRVRSASDERKEQEAAVRAMHDEEQSAKRKAEAELQRVVLESNQKAQAATSEYESAQRDRDRESNARARRASLVKMVTDHAEAVMRHQPAVTEYDNPADALSQLGAVRALVDELYRENPNAEDAAPLEAKVAEWSTELTARVTAEQQCRASTECIGARLGAALCEEIAERVNLSRDLAKERANPAGVINLRFMHSLGTAMQEADGRIAEMKKVYQRVTARPFSEGRCKAAGASAASR